VAEWLGRALQKLLQQFESARDLLSRQDGKDTILSAFLFAESRVQTAMTWVDFLWFSGVPLQPQGALIVNALHKIGSIIGD
jgi:hypothetical protein